MRIFLLLILHLAWGQSALATDTLWPELSFSMGSAQLVGDARVQAVPGYEIGILFWGPENLVPGARSGFFALEFGGYRFTNHGTKFLGSEEQVHNSTSTMMPYVRLFGSEEAGYFLAGVGFRFNSLSFESRGRRSQQTLGSYVGALEYLYPLRDNMRLGAKVNWSSMDQILADHYSFIETTGLMVILTYQP